MFEHEDGTWSFMDEDKTDEYVGLCKAMVAGARTGLFDVIAHPNRAFRRCKDWNPDMMRASREVITEAKNIISGLKRTILLCGISIDIGKSLDLDDVMKTQLHGQNCQNLIQKMSIHNISHLDRVRIKKTWGEHK